MSTMDPYEHCVLAATSMTAGGTGFPDGNLTPSVTLDYKQVITLTPESGVIDFMLAPSAHSAVNMFKGNVTGLFRAAYDYSASTTTGFQGVTPTTQVGAISINTLPSYTSGLGLVPQSEPTASVFRPIVLVADIAYTGNSMMDGGAVQLQRVANSETVTGTNTIGTPAYACDSATFADPRNIGYTAASESFMAKQSFTTRVVAHEPKYETVRPSYVANGTTGATDARPFCYPTNLSSTNPGLAPSYHSSCEWTRITYTGLDASASITVTLRYCVQFGVNPSSSTYAPLARPSPAARPGIVTRVTNFVRSQPLATTFGRSLWEGIKRVGRAVLPTIFPGIGGIVAGLL